MVFLKIPAGGFMIIKGIRQGCPFLPFLLVAEFLDIFITLCVAVQGILILERTFSN